MQSQRMKRRIGKKNPCLSAQLFEAQIKRHSLVLTGQNFVFADLTGLKCQHHRQHRQRHNGVCWSGLLRRQLRGCSHALAFRKSASDLVGSMFMIGGEALVAFTVTTSTHGHRTKSRLKTRHPTSCQRIVVVCGAVCRPKFLGASWHSRDASPNQCFRPRRRRGVPVRTRPSRSSLKGLFRFTRDLSLRPKTGLKTTIHSLLVAHEFRHVAYYGTSPGRAEVEIERREDEIITAAVLLHSAYSLKLAPNGVFIRPLLRPHSSLWPTPNCEGN